MDNEMITEARKKFIRTTIGLYHSGILSKEQVLNALDNNLIETTPEEKEKYKAEVLQLLVKK